MNQIPKHLRGLLLVLGIAGMTAAAPARAEWSLAAGGAWADVGGTRPAASIAWREPVAAGWQGELRTRGEGLSLAARFAPVRRVGAAAYAVLSAGVLARTGAPGAFVRVVGYEAASSVMLPLRPNAALEFTGRWVVRGDRGTRGPERFSAQWAEITVGLTFAPEW